MLVSQSTGMTQSLRPCTCHTCSLLSSDSSVAKPPFNIRLDDFATGMEPVHKAVVVSAF